MRNILLIVLISFVSGQAAWADGDDKKDTRKALRGTNREGGEEVRKKLEELGLGDDKGRPESGRPGRDDGEEEPKRGDEKIHNKKHHHHPELREIIEKELKLTEEQMKKLHKIHSALHKRVEAITGGKEFSDLSKDQKEKLQEAWHKFRSARAEILSEEQLAKLKEIHERHRERHEKGEGEREKGKGGEIGEDEREKAIREKREKGKGGEIGEDEREKAIREKREKGGKGKGEREKGEGGREKGEGGQRKR